MASTPSEGQSQPSRLATAGRVLTLSVTYVTKLAGAVLAIHEGFGHGRSTILATAAFMMTGAQVSEGVILAAIDRFISAKGKD